MSVIHRGKIVDNLSMPLVGAHVISLNSSPRKFTIADAFGVFGIEGEPGESFEITFIGMKPIRFTLLPNMAFKTYQMVEDATQLDEFTGTPTKPVKNNNSGEWWRDALSQVTNIFDAASANTANTPPFNVDNTPVITGQQNYVPVPAVTGNNGSGNWVSNNPLAAGGILLALVAGGTYLMSNKKKSSSTAKKTATGSATSKK